MYIIRNGIIAVIVVVAAVVVSAYFCLFYFFRVYYPVETERELSDGVLSERRGRVKERNGAQRRRRATDTVTCLRPVDQSARHGRVLWGGLERA